MKRRVTLIIIFTIAASFLYPQKKQPVDWVDLFIGTTNFGTTNPGAVIPNGMMSVVPFNVMGSKDNAFDKDARWWSTGCMTNCILSNKSLIFGLINL